MGITVYDINKIRELYKGVFLINEIIEHIQKRKSYENGLGCIGGIHSVSNELARFNAHEEFSELREVLEGE